MLKVTVPSAGPLRSMVEEIQSEESDDDDSSSEEETPIKTNPTNRDSRSVSPKRSQISGSPALKVTLVREIMNGHRVCVFVCTYTLASYSNTTVFTLDSFPSLPPGHRGDFGLIDPLT